MGLRRTASRGRPVAHVHLSFSELRGVPEATAEDRASNSTGAHPHDRRQSRNPQERHGSGVARRSPEDRAFVHPERGSIAEPHRALVASFPTAGAGRPRFRRWLRDRLGHESRDTAAKPESQSVGVGSSSETAEASEARVCVPPLRNGAGESSFPLFTALSWVRLCPVGFQPLAVHSPRPAPSRPGHIAKAAPTAQVRGETRERAESGW